MAAIIHPFVAVHASLLTLMCALRMRQTSKKPIDEDLERAHMLTTLQTWIAKAKGQLGTLSQELSMLEQMAAHRLANPVAGDAGADVGGAIDRRCVPLQAALLPSKHSVHIAHTHTLQCSLAVPAVASTNSLRHYHHLCAHT